MQNRFALLMTKEKNRDKVNISENTESTERHCRPLFAAGGGGGSFVDDNLLALMIAERARFIVRVFSPLASKALFMRKVKPVKILLQPLCRRSSSKDRCSRFG